MAFRMSEQPRTIKIYNLLAGTNEFIGEGDAYIPPHTRTWIGVSAFGNNSRCNVSENGSMTVAH